MTEIAWVLLAFGNERQYQGNAGYNDDPARIYQYDSFVPNCRRIRESDLVLLRTKDEILGVARISTIIARSGEKTRQRCPTCGSTAIKARQKLIPVFRCNDGHEFNEPLTATEQCLKFEAHFGDSFVPISEPYDREAFRAAYVSANGQMSMQQIRIAALPRSIVTALRSVAPGAIALSADEADDYVPSNVDQREQIAAQIRARRGQKAFRRAVRQRFDDSCAISACRVVDLLEAAHISPYRGRRDNHISNGLLLRADLHTLFDLDLLGIHPKALTVHLNPIVRANGYDNFEGTRIQVQQHLSAEALAARWRVFEEKARHTMALIDAKDD